MPTRLRYIQELELAVQDFFELLLATTVEVEEVSLGQPEDHWNLLDE